MKKCELNRVGKAPDMVPPMEVFTYKYFTISPLPQQPGRKTRDYTVNRHFGNILGRIAWYAPWRCYCFLPNENTVWSSDCLASVQKFTEYLNKGR